MTHKTVSIMLEIHQTDHLYQDTHTLMVRDSKHIITEIFQDFPVIIGIYHETFPNPPIQHNKTTHKILYT